MVKTYGMSEVLGQVSLDDGRASTFLPHNQNPSAHEYSEITAREIDAEVRRIIDTQYVRATQILGAQRDVLCTAARVLLQKETISGAELQEILYPSNGHASRDDTHVATVH
jgi:cell division protease FtsH